MRFKTDRVEKEYNSGNLSHNLVQILHEAEDIVKTYGYYVTITHVYRTQTEQMALYPNEPDKRSVHEFWRGADVSVKGWPHGIIEMVKQQLNERYPYDVTRPHIRTVYRHDSGHGDHLHFQVPA